MPQPPARLPGCSRRDVATVGGILLLMATRIAAAIRHRDRLPDETVFTRAARRLRARAS